MIEVLINDEKSGGYDHNHSFFKERGEWAQQHCKSFCGYHVQDVSDVSYIWDEIACYTFTSEKDATMFRLKWL